MKVNLCGNDEGDQIKHHTSIQISSLSCKRKNGEEIEWEHICWDPKNHELCLHRMKPEETLVEVRSDTDVQIVH